MTLWGAENEAMRYVVPDQWFSNFSSPRTSFTVPKSAADLFVLSTFFSIIEKLDMVE